MPSPDSSKVLGLTSLLPVRSTPSSPPTSFLLPPVQRLRPLSYSKSHIILIAFALDTPDSLENVQVSVSSFVRGGPLRLPCVFLEGTGTHDGCDFQYIASVRLRGGRRACRSSRLMATSLCALLNRSNGSKKSDRYVGLRCL